MRSFNQRIKKLALWFAIVLGALTLLKTIHIAGPVKGLVLEDATGKPIEGAIVAISWPVKEPGFHGSRGVGFTHLQETLTNEKGEFSFWPWIDFFSWRYFVESAGPELIAAKSGFAPMHMTSHRSTPHQVGKLVENQGNSKLQFLLAPAKPNVDNYTYWTAAYGFGAQISSEDKRSCVFDMHAPNFKTFAESHDPTGKTILPRSILCN